MSVDPVETPPSRWSTRKLCIAYDTLRKRYYLDGLGRVPPPSSALRISWIKESSPTLAVTHFDDDDGEPIEPESLEVNLVCRTVPDLMRRVLLHELSHMRLGKDVRCSTDAGPLSPAWRAETVRLAALGAPLL